MFGMEQKYVCYWMCELCNAGYKTGFSYSTMKIETETHYLTTLIIFTTFYSKNVYFSPVMTE
jgi:hypothetical protein